jgi:hypothetical protein
MTSLLSALPAGNSHRACLWAIISCFFDKADFGSDCQFLKPAIQHAIFVEVDFTAVGRFKVSVAFFGKKPADAGARRPPSWRFTAPLCFRA